MSADLFFILGGEDNEMAEIKRVLLEEEISFWQPQEDWGKIMVKMERLPGNAKGKKLVFVEARPGPNLKDEHEVLVIDHHDELSDRPASLLQVLELLGKEPSLRQQLIASIDSDFLRVTIEKWPEHKDEIVEIWESGYRKGFPREKDYQIFKEHCKLLFDQAKKKPLIDDQAKGIRLLGVEQSPPSFTMIAAMADLEGYDCVQCLGKFGSDKVKPCFYQGQSKVVNQLSEIAWQRKYWGRRYIGVRAVPGEFVEAVRKGYQD